MNSYIRRTLRSLLFLDTYQPLFLGILIYSVHEILVTPNCSRSLLTSRFHEIADGLNYESQRNCQDSDFHYWRNRSDRIGCAGRICRWLCQEVFRYKEAKKCIKSYGGEKTVDRLAVFRHASLLEFLTGRFGSEAEIIAQELRVAAMQSEAVIHCLAWQTSALGQRWSVEPRESKAIGRLFSRILAFVS